MGTIVSNEWKYDKLLEDIAEINKDKGYKLSLDFLEDLTGLSLDEKQIIAHNDELTKQFKHIIASYGFKDYHSLYLYALADEVDRERTQKNKDFASLNKVKRTVVRNGQQTTMTFYEKPRGLDNKLKGRRDSDKESSKENTDASSFFTTPVGSVDQPLTIEDLHTIQGIQGGMAHIVGKLDDVHRVVLLTDYEQVRATIGITLTERDTDKENEYAVAELSYMAQDGTVANLYIRAILETIKYAMENGLGFREELNETKEQQWLMESLEFKLNSEDEYLLDPEQVLDMFGELP